MLNLQSPDNIYNCSYKMKCGFWTTEPIYDFDRSFIMAGLSLLTASSLYFNGLKYPQQLTHSQNDLQTN